MKTYEVRFSTIKRGQQYRTVRGVTEKIEATIRAEFAGAGDAAFSFYFQAVPPVN